MAKKEAKKKGRSLEQVEAEMAKLRKEKDSLHAKRQSLAAERRAIILGSQASAQGGTIVMPEPAILTAKTEQ